MFEEIINRQKQLNKMFEEEGLTDEILNEQLEINRLRNKHNIVLEDEINEEGYVQ